MQQVEIRTNIINLNNKMEYHFLLFIFIKYIKEYIFYIDINILGVFMDVKVQNFLIFFF